MIARRPFLMALVSLGFPSGLLGKERLAAVKPQHTSLERFRDYLLPGLWGFGGRDQGVESDLIVRQHSIELMIQKGQRRRTVTIFSRDELFKPFPTLTAVERMSAEFASMGIRLEC